MSLLRKQLLLAIALTLSTTCGHNAHALGGTEIEPDNERFGEMAAQVAMPVEEDSDFYFARHATTGNGRNVSQVLDAQLNELIASDFNELHKDERNRTSWRLNELPPDRAGAILEQLAGSPNASLGSATQNALKPLNTGLMAAMRQLDSHFESAGRVWLQNLGSSGNFDGRQGSTELKQRTQGLMLGADWSLNHAWRIGVLGAKSGTQLHAKPFTGTLDSWHLGGYAVRQDGPLALRLGAIYSRHAGQNKRSVDLDFFNYREQLRGDYSASNQHAFAELGYSLNTDSLNIEPFASLGYQRYHRDSFEENGGYTALKVGAQTQENLSNTFGFRLSGLHTLDNQMSFKPHLSLSWKHLYGEVGSNVRQSFARAARPDMNTQFTIDGTALDRNAVALNVGLDLALSAQHNVGLAYSAEAGSYSQNQGLIGQWTMAF